jgi:hypothetical protein
VGLFNQYEGLIGRLAKPLSEDSQHFKPVDGSYSPYGAIYGTSTNLIEDMALKTVQLDAMTQFALEDVFADVNPGDDRLAWVNGWRKLPHVDEAVQRLYEYPRQYADDFFARVEQALKKRISDREADDALKIGCLIAAPGDDLDAGSKKSQITDLPVRYIRSSDEAIVAARQAESCDDAQLLRDRQEGYFVVSYRTSGGWLAIKKDMLTEVLGAGCDVNLVGLPIESAGVFRLMCPGLVTSDGVQGGQASMPPSIVKA